MLLASRSGPVPSPPSRLAVGARALAAGLAAQTRAWMAKAFLVSRSGPARSPPSLAVGARALAAELAPQARAWVA